MPWGERGTPALKELAFYVGRSRLGQELGQASQRCGPTLATACFHVAQELSWTFIFLMLKKKKDIVFHREQLLLLAVRQQSLEYLVSGACSLVGKAWGPWG